MPSGPHHEAGSPLAALRYAAGSDAGEEIPIAVPVVTIGQGPRQDVVLDDDTVSTSHARLEYRDGGWWLTDLGSRNGTYVEGGRLEPSTPTPLRDGASLRFGGVGVIFQERSAAQAERARSTRTTPIPAEPERPAAGFRLPVWVLLLVVLAILLVMLLFAWLGGQPQVEPPPVDAVLGIPGTEPPLLAA